MRALLVLWLSCMALAGSAHTQGTLPPEVSAALARAKVPLEAVSLLVVAVDGKTEPRLSHRANAAMNPASVMKLVTTYAALDILGPTFVWTTSVHIDGPVKDGTLQGNLYLKGQGDPKLVLERLWLLLRRVQGLGIKTIAGDIVLDRSAFETVAQNPGDFDGEPLRPYNAAPDALLLNFKSVVMTFVPDRAAQMARVNYEPPLAGVQMQTSVPLVNGECNDYRAALKADMSDVNRIRFGGSYSNSCGERAWPLAYADPASYSARAVEGVWREMGGQLGGRMREGQVPTTLPAILSVNSQTLAETIRDINKFSNNVMAQQLFLTLSLQSKGEGTMAGSRALVQDWWRERMGTVQPPVLDNGSGLSRTERISAEALMRLLQTAWASPLMPELVSSLPIVGVDGTLRRIKGRSAGNAHLKSGSLRDVVAIAGYVHALNGQRHALVAIVNHPNAQAARPALESLVEWSLRDAGQRLPKDVLANTRASY
jgi:serine-type D-Ala-D-Ala carboxypeptidase/endopeptidase (penicillin-binding protein 4)